MLVRVLFGHLPDRFGGLPVAVSSLAVETIGQVLIWSAPDPGLALAGAFLTGLGCSLIYPPWGERSCISWPRTCAARLSADLVPSRMSLTA